VNSRRKPFLHIAVVLSSNGDYSVFR
jgi:hypothetical protein